MRSQPKLIPHKSGSMPTQATEPRFLMDLPWFVLETYQLTLNMRLLQIIVFSGQEICTFFVNAATRIDLTSS